MCIEQNPYEQKKRNMQSVLGETHLFTWLHIVQSSNEEHFYLCFPSTHHVHVFTIRLIVYDDIIQHTGDSLGNWYCQTLRAWVYIVPRCGVSDQINIEAKYNIFNTQDVVPYVLV